MMAATAAANGEDRAIDLSLARSYFDEAAAISDLDGGELWGRPLYGPMLFADPATRMVVANEADLSRALKPEGNVFVGTLPQKMNISNTATVWSGKRWTMLMWPLPVSKKPRAQLLAHEMWHRIQNQLALSTSGAENGHLDTPNGRIWMRLEWRAWSRAIGSAGNERREGLLQFRDRQSAEPLAQWLTEELSRVVRR